MGDVQGTLGDLGESSYYERYQTRIEPNISLDIGYTETPDEYFNNLNGTYTFNPVNGTYTHVPNTINYKFRNSYWSAIWRGMITPTYAEMYRFSIDVDPDSTVKLRIGGLGTEFNQSDSGTMIINYTSGNEHS